MRKETLALLFLGDNSNTMVLISVRKKGYFYMVMVTIKCCPCAKCFTSFSCNLTDNIIITKTWCLLVLKWLESHALIPYSNVFPSETGNQCGVLKSKTRGSSGDGESQGRH